MDIHMAGSRCQHAVVRAQKGGNGSQVGLGAAHQKVDVCALAADGPADEGCGVGTVAVQSVAYRLFQIGAGKGLQNAGVATLRVVVFKAEHSVPPKETAHTAGVRCLTYFLKLSFRLTARLNTSTPGLESLLSAQK